PERIVYVSCHPATLARDIKVLSAAYEVKSVTAVDLFPQTSHIETVARLERR
ncbi:MAG: 23S rRNA (uracil-5-)-methyltransferase RumA, partial [Elusimicrobia bacterium]|nr:23S rRNA (uracil-5-)-methyltransferase RumA [Elusimicrobiota bacterium]